MTTSSRLEILPFNLSQKRLNDILRVSFFYWAGIFFFLDVRLVVVVCLFVPCFLAAAAAAASVIV
jgi:hypothetical protein